MTHYQEGYIRENYDKETVYKMKLHLKIAHDTISNFMKSENLPKFTNRVGTLSKEDRTNYFNVDEVHCWITGKDDTGKDSKESTKIIDERAKQLREKIK